MSALAEFLHKVVDILPLHSEQVQQDFHKLADSAANEAVPAPTEPATDPES